MTKLSNDLEVERVMNLVRGFGWEKTEQMMDEKYLFIKIRKPLAQERQGVPE